MKRGFLLLLCLVFLALAASAAAQTEPLRVMVYDRENMPEEYGTCEDNAWVRYVQSRVARELDIQLEFVSVKRVDDVAQVNLLASQNEPPDLMFTYDYEFWLALCRNGLVADITDALAAHGQTLQTSHAAVLPYGVINGRQYAIPCLRSATDVTSGFIRKDWLDRLGIELPVTDSGGYALTTDQLLEILRAFQQADLGGQGQAAPVFLSYGTSYWPMLLILEAFYDQSAILDEDLASLPFFLYTGAKEGYRYLNMLYNQGLLNSDFATIGDNDKSQYSQAITEGTVGFWINDSWFGLDSDNGAVMKLYRNDPAAEVVAVDLLGPSGKPAYKYTYNDYGMMVFVSARSEHVDAALRYLDWLAKPENDFVLRYGFENEHYRLENGMPVKLDDVVAQQERISVNDLALMYNGYAYAPGNELDARLSLGQLPEQLRSLRRDSWHVAMTNSFSLPTLTGYIPASFETSRSLFAREQELRVRTIMCAETDFDAEWERCVTAYLEAGGSRVIEARRTAWYETKADKKGN